MCARRCLHCTHSAGRRAAAGLEPASCPCSRWGWVTATHIACEVGGLCVTVPPCWAPGSELQPLRYSAAETGDLGGSFSSGATGDVGGRLPSSSSWCKGASWAPELASPAAAPGRPSAGARLLPRMGKGERGVRERTVDGLIQGSRRASESSRGSCSFCWAKAR